MTGDSAAGKVTDVNTTQPDSKPTDNLNAVRLAAATPQEATTPGAAGAYLPQTVIRNDVQSNPAQVPLTYDPSALNFAKMAGFSLEQINVMEEAGPDHFNREMQHLAARPDKIPETKVLVNQIGFWQSHPDVPFNPFKIPGVYNPQSINFARSQGFDPNQVHVLQQYGPDNFNNTMAYLEQNPAQIANFKSLAAALVGWESQPDLPADPKAGASTVSPEADKFAQANGFDPAQIQVLKSFGAGNFNNTMQFLSEHGEKVQDVKGLADMVEYWVTRMVPPPATP